MPKFLALIPARSGSKGVPRKNLRQIDGKPLIAYTIEAAKLSSYVSEVYVSSDDAEILSISQALNCRLVTRPVIYAGDDATAVDVVRHFLRDAVPDLASENPYVVYLQPTSPLRTAAHIDAAIAMMLAERKKTLTSVVELDKSPFKSFTIGADGTLSALFDEKLSNLGRQALPKTYAANGAIYIFDCASFLDRGEFPTNGGVPFLMSNADSVDIDTEDDIRLVQSILENRNARISN